MHNGEKLIAAKSAHALRPCNCALRLVLLGNVLRRDRIIYRGGTEVRLVTR